MSPEPQPTAVVQSSREPAPGELALLQRFVNSVDLEDGIEELDSPASLRRWLAERDLIARNAKLGEPDLRRAIELREALRLLLHANNGAPVDADALETVNAAARASQLVVRFDGEGGARLEPARRGLDGALGTLLAIAYRSMVDGTWERLKACPEETCGWAFYDRSRNRSSTWCSMAVCGNRAKARAFRRRHGADRAGGAAS
ncbi:MAG TPA: CGNR zinc finger domain-containing protein [Thermoleophilaceae bacterium]